MSCQVQNASSSESDDWRIKSRLENVIIGTERMGIVLDSSDIEKSLYMFLKTGLALSCK